MNCSYTRRTLFYTARRTCRTFLINCRNYFKRWNFQSTPYIEGDVQTLPVRDTISLRGPSFVSADIIHRTRRWRNIYSIASGWAIRDVSVSLDLYVRPSRRAVHVHNGHVGDLLRIIFAWVIRQDFHFSVQLYIQSTPLYMQSTTIENIPKDNLARTIDRGDAYAHRFPSCNTILIKCYI